MTIATGRSRRWLSARAGAVVLGLLVVGCGSSATSPSNSGSAAANPPKGTPFVMAAFGGVNGHALEAACLDPFAAAHGLTPSATTDSSLAKLQLQVQTNNVTWNVALDPTPGPVGFSSLLEPINYSIVGTNQSPKSLQWPDAVGISTVAGVLVYNATAYGSNVPESWSDFFNLTKFPGQRMMPSVAYNGPYAISEMAEMAYTGASTPKYPIDQTQVFDEMNKIKGHVTLYTSTTQAEEAIVSGQADMVMLSADHAIDAIAGLPKGAAQYKIQWNQNLSEANYFVVPKGAPYPQLGMEFIHYCLSTAAQITYSNISADGPVNPAAAAALPAATLANEPAGHVSVAAPIDQAYWTPATSATWTNYWESYQISS